LSLEWNRDEVMHSESGDNDGDDDEPVKDEMTVTGTHHQPSTGCQRSRSQRENAILSQYYYSILGNRGR